LQLVCPDTVVALALPHWAVQNYLDIGCICCHARLRRTDCAQQSHAVTTQRKDINGIRDPHQTMGMSSSVL